MDYFSADHHFFHSNIIKYANRPFESMEEMNETLIARHNEVVKEDDTVYFLGDFSLLRGEQSRDVWDIFFRLNGNIKFIPGGHDWWLSETEVKHLGAYQTLSNLGVLEILPPLVTIEYPEYH